MTHPYFEGKARSVFTRASGDPDHSGPLAEWAERVRPTNDSRLGVLVSEDGTLLAETRHVPGGPGGASASYVREVLDPRVKDLENLEVGLAAARATRITGQPVIHVKFSEVCTGAGRPAKAKPTRVHALLDQGRIQKLDDLLADARTVKPKATRTSVIERLIDDAHDQVLTRAPQNPGLGVIMNAADFAKQFTSAQPLPRGVHLATKTARGDGQETTLLVVWADYAFSRCPRCNEEVAKEVECPVMLTRALQPVEEVDRLHHCGKFLPVLWETLDWQDISEHLDPDAAVRTVTKKLAGKREEEITEGRAQIRASLLEDLAAAIQRYREPLEEDETLEDRRQEVTVGEHDETGVALSRDGHWSAWGADPVDTDAPIVVDVADLRAATLAALNDYDGENIWDDVILRLSGYDEESTDEVEAGASDAFVAAGIHYRFEVSVREWVVA